MSSNRRLESLAKGPKKASKSTVVIDYTEINQDLDKDKELILNNRHSLTQDELKEVLTSIVGHRNITVDNNFILELNCDNAVGKRILDFLVKDPNKMHKLPNIKRLRIDNVSVMINETRLLLKYCMPDEFSIMNFNVNGNLIDMSLFIELMCDTVINKVTNLYLYYMMCKEKGIEMLCDAIHQNPNFQDLRIYASRIDVSLLAKYMQENNSIWLLSLSFDHLTASDAEHVIAVMKKLKNLKEFCAHRNAFGDEGCNEIAHYIADNLIGQLDLIDLSHNQTVENTYITILQENGYKGVLK